MLNHRRSEPAPIRALIKPDEAAMTLAISQRLLWSLTKSGQIPSVRINRAVRYDPRDLEAWIDRRKTASSGGGIALTSGPNLALVDTSTAAKASAV